MGFFDKMFEKKECAICGTELGLLGKTKINEGYLCKECVGKLSPFFGGYRSSTADDIREQLAYREANAERLASFNPTRTLSAGRTNIMLDEDAGLLIITSQTRDSVVAAKAPKTAVTCPFCGATTIPDASGRCEYCGGAIGA